MSVYLISYDLRKPDYDYDPVYEELDNLNAKHIQDSLWAVQSDKTAKQLFEILWPHFHNANDRLIVCLITAWWGIHNISTMPDF